MPMECLPDQELSRAIARVVERRTQWLYDTDEPDVDVLVHANRDYVVIALSLGASLAKRTYLESPELRSTTAWAIAQCVPTPHFTRCNGRLRAHQLSADTARRDRIGPHVWYTVAARCPSTCSPPSPRLRNDSTRGRRRALWPRVPLHSGGHCGGASGEVQC